MKPAIASILFCALAFARSTSESIDARDNLVPLNAGNVSFREVLTSKLIIAPFNYAGVLFLPAFEGESFVSVYNHDRTRPTCHVTYIKAQSNLYQATDGGKHPENAGTIPVIRIDAEIPEDMARKLREIWKRMLDEAHPHVAQSQDWQTVPVDATRIEFALELSGSQTLYGEVDIFESNPGEKVKCAIDLSHRLIDYCKAGPTQRLPITSDIGQKAEALLTRLKEAQ
jgi:hypothetical protein